MILTIEFAELFEKVADFQGEMVLLTPNKRLSRFLSEHYNQYQVKQQREAWPSLQVFSVQAWIQRHWESLSFSAFAPPDHLARSKASALLRRAPMTAFQERILWQRVVSNHPDTPPLLSSKATAALAMEAWHLLQRWQLSLPEDDEESNSALFRAWCEAFAEECAKRNLVSASQQAAVVCKALKHNTLQAPDWLLLYGFDEQTPELRALISTLRAAGSQTEEFTWGQPAQSAQRHEFMSEKSEIEASALWARQHLQTRPNARIAIVVPKLAQLRQTIEQVFNRVFEAQYILPQQPQHAPGFNISAGQNFDSLPLVATALNALACNAKLLDIEDVSRLLRSPFIGLEQELNPRALLDLSLRDTDIRISLRQLIEAAGQPQKRPQKAPPSEVEGNGKEKGKDKGADEAAPETEAPPRRCPFLYQSLVEFTQIAQSAGKTQLCSRWAHIFQRQLQALGWPGQRELDQGQRQLDTLEYQQWQRWREALLEMSMLDCVSEPITWHQALQYLRSLLQQISFQAQTKSSPIQILGLLEAASLPFDHLWLMNMDDETWPPPPQPNPLLPLNFQIQHGMPQSSPQRELAYARRLLERFSHSADDIVFSHATQHEDKQMRLSALLDPVPLQPFKIPPDASLAEQLFAQRQLESSIDSCGPKIIDPATIRGGSAIIKDQSACPFQSFARHRLHAQAMPSSSMGLDAKERGILVHRVMELIWGELLSHSKLLQYSDAELDQLIQESVTKSLRALPLPHAVGERFLSIEAQRLTQQVHAWMQLEKNREPFTVVSNEGRKTTKLGKLPLTVRYDRVDRLADGSLLVLDYKTGKQQLRAWASNRPEEPQVPLYCVINHKKVSGGAFGQIAADEIAIKGICEEKVAPGLTTPDMLFKLDLPDTWPEIVKHWRGVLEQLAQDFMAGAAAVDPKNPALTCRFCELQALCRIKEQFSPDDEDGDHTAHSELLELASLD